ncbi:MAG: hypothetical protein ACTHJQ_25455 [Rhizobiaceae bacterium]
MSQDAKQFIQFVAATLILGLIGGAIVKSGLPQSYAVPFGFLWLAIFLAVTGYIIQGRSGAVELVRITALAFGALLAVVFVLSFILGY